MNIESCGVYSITSPSGSRYIGMTTVSFNSRWRAHEKDFMGDQGKCLGLHRAFSKYGLDAMKWDVLEDCFGEDESSILRKERLWWLKFNSEGVKLYNGEPSGSGSVRHTNETLSKISASANSRAELNPHSRRNRPCALCGVRLGKLNQRNKYCFDCRGKSRQSDMWANKDLIKKLYLDENMTTASIGKLFDVSQQSAYRAIEKMGFLIPKHSDYKAKQDI